MFKIGDKVSVLDETGILTIIDIIGNSCLVEDEYGFEKTIAAKDLVLYEPKKYSGIAVYNQDITIKKAVNPKKKRISTKHVPVVDLHMENLVDSHKHMSNHEIVTYQLNYFIKKLDSYIKNNVKQCVVVHGVGKGKLKKEVRYLLDSKYPFVEYMDDHYTTYGVGATRIFIS